MSSGAVVFWSGMLTYGVPLAFAVYELIKLRRGRDDRWREKQPPRPVPPRPTGGTPAQKPLPACLIPVRRTEPVRVRELA